jgi:acetyl esterase/lipase
MRASDATADVVGPAGAVSAGRPTPFQPQRPWFVGLLSRLAIGQLQRCGVAPGTAPFRQIDRRPLEAVQPLVPITALGSRATLAREDVAIPAADGRTLNTARLYTPIRRHDGRQQQTISSTSTSTSTSARGTTDGGTHGAKAWLAGWQRPWLRTAAAADHLTREGVGGTIDGDTAKGARAPLLVYVHGGGWALNDARTQPYESVCSRLAEALGWPVLSLNYRRAPEHPFPAAVDDVYAALEWMAAQPSVAPAADRHRIVLMGESAGANLAACAALMWRDRQPLEMTVVHQVLVSPCVPCRPLRPSRTDPARRNGAFLPAWLMTWFEESYAGSARDVEALAREPYANPLAAVSLSGVPSLTGVVGDGEVLRDEGVEFFEAVAAAGVDVDWREWAHGYHAFPVFPFGAARREAEAYILSRLRASVPESPSRPIGAPVAAPGSSRLGSRCRPPPTMQLGTGFQFEDGEQLLVSVQKPIGMVLEEAEEAGAEAGSSGCVVAVVVDGSAASRAGVQTGFRLLAVNNMDVRASSLDEVMALLLQSPRVVNLRFATL